MSNITKERVIEGMTLLLKNKDKDFESVREILKEAGIDWSIEEATLYYEAYGAVVPLGIGMDTGNIGFGATFVANAIDSPRGYAYCREWLGEWGVGLWLKENDVNPSEYSQDKEQIEPDL